MSTLCQTLAELRELLDVPQPPTPVEVEPSAAHAAKPTPPPCVALPLVQTDPQPLPPPVLPSPAQTAARCVAARGATYLKFTTLVGWNAGDIAVPANPQRRMFSFSAPGTYAGICPRDPAADVSTFPIAWPMSWYNTGGGQVWPVYDECTFGIAVQYAWVHMDTVSPSPSVVILMEEIYL